MFDQVEVTGSRIGLTNGRDKTGLAGAQFSAFQFPEKGIYLLIPKSWFVAGEAFAYVLEQSAPNPSVASTRLDFIRGYERLLRGEVKLETHSGEKITELAAHQRSDQFGAPHKEFFKSGAQVWYNALSKTTGDYAFGLLRNLLIYPDDQHMRADLEKNTDNVGNDRKQYQTYVDLESQKCLVAEDEEAVTVDGRKVQIRQIWDGTTITVNASNLDPIDPSSWIVERMQLPASTETAGVTPVLAWNSEQFLSQAEVERLLEVADFYPKAKPDVFLGRVIAQPSISGGFKHDKRFGLPVKNTKAVLISPREVAVWASSPKRFQEFLRSNLVNNVKQLFQ